MTVTDTSLQAYKKLRDTGELNERQQLCLQAVKTYGPATAREMWQKLQQHETPKIYGKVYSSIQPGWTELRSKDIIEVKEKRPCNVTGRMAHVYGVKR